MATDVREIDRPSQSGPVRHSRVELAMFVGSLIAVFAYRSWMYLAIARHSRLTGDENVYWENTLQLLHIFGIRRIDSWTLAEAFDAILGSGWFLPGTTVLLTPARLVSDSPAVARLWMGALTFVALSVVADQLRRMFSIRVATIVLIVAGALPYTAWFSMTLWGGSMGGLLMLLNLLWAARITRNVRQGFDPKWRSLALLGLSVGFNILVRPPSLGQLLPVACLFLLGYLEGSPAPRAIAKSAVRFAAVATVAGLLVLPWQIAITLEFGGPFFLVTSGPMNEIIEFGDPDELESVGDTFVRLGRHLEDLADERDQTLYEVSASEHQRIVGEVPFIDRLGAARASMTRFFDEENFFLNRALAPLEKPNLAWLTRLNSGAWFVVTLTVLYAFLRPWRLWEADGLLGIVMRAVFFVMLYQPLTRTSHGRHISYLMPLLILIAALAVVGCDQRTPEPTANTRWPRLERAMSIAFGTVVVAFLAFVVLF